jgi:hypothetical protein
MQTGSPETPIGWKSGKTTFVPLWDRVEGAWLLTLRIGENFTAADSDKEDDIHQRALIG